MSSILGVTNSSKRNVKHIRSHEVSSKRNVEKKCQKEMPSTLWSKPSTPPGGISYLLCSLIKNWEEEDPPRRTTPKMDQFWGWFFRGGPLPPGSWSGNIVNRKPPRGGGFLSIKIHDSEISTNTTQDTQDIYTLSDDMNITWCLNLRVGSIKF